MPPSRSHAIDHIRIGLTVLVILHHTAIVYGGSGGWYWREQPNGSQPLLLLFNAINQAHFMGFFFLLAGYFTPGSYDRKGCKGFLRDRLLRLGVPLSVYFLLISPMTIALARTHEGNKFWRGWWDMFLDGRFGPGPLWFAQTLLIFSGAYALWRRLTPGAAETSRQLPSFPKLAITAAALGVASFAVRLWIPVGKEVASMQLGYFPCYMYLFAAGCVAARSQLLERIPLGQARGWIVVSLLALISLPIVMAFRANQGGFEGGWNWNALFYALWDPSLAWGVILGALWGAQRFWSVPNALTRWMSPQVYAVFIIHPPIVVGFGLLAAEWSAPPLLKFLTVGTASSMASFGLAALIRLIPLAGRIL